jgi:septal ring factor EnvC (AmiA/AmiB activator)
MCELAEKRTSMQQTGSRQADLNKRIQLQYEQLKVVTAQLKAARNENVKVVAEHKGTEEQLKDLKREFGYLADSYKDVLTKLHENLEVVNGLKEAYRLLGEENTELRVRAATAFQEMTPRVDFGPVNAS